MNIVVTGGSGFVGEKLVLELIKMGHEVVVVDVGRVPYVSDSSCKLKGAVDITCLDEIVNASKGADLVYHLAGTVLDSCRKDPYNSAKLDLLGTANVIEACRLNNINKIIYASSFYVYDRLNENSIVDEKSQLTNILNIELFGFVKLSGEKLILNYNKKYGLTYNILRFGPIYGSGVRCSSAVCDFISQGIKNEPIVIWGTGRRMNQYTYIDDIVRGCIASCNFTNETFNLINPQRTSLKELGDILKETYGFNVSFDASKKEGLSLPEISAEKSLVCLGLKYTSLEEGLDKVIKAYSAESD